MKRTYESFKELAEDITNGDSIIHKGLDHHRDPCISWQRGIKLFAELLDKAKIKVPKDLYDKFWDSINE